MGLSSRAWSTNGDIYLKQWVDIVNINGRGILDSITFGSYPDISISIDGRLYFEGDTNTFRERWGNNVISSSGSGSFVGTAINVNVPTKGGGATLQWHKMNKPFNSSLVIKAMGGYMRSSSISYLLEV